MVATLQRRACSLSDDLSADEVPATGGHQRFAPVDSFFHKHAVGVGAAVCLRRAAGGSVHIHHCAAVEHIRAQGAARGDADLRELRAVAEGAVAEA